MGIILNKTEYFPVRELDKDEKGSVMLVEAEGRQYVLRTMNGRISPYLSLRKISSPYIPKIEFAEFDGEKTTVLEEYISGGKNISSLTDESSVIAAFCELCDVLDILHRHGIVHRDIKPSNILIAPDGHIRLIDFDASRRYDDSKDNDTHCLGTKGYAPPEQFGYSQTSAASDIYSLGVTLKTVLADRADKPRFRKIIRKCTEFDPKNRYKSAVQLKKELKYRTKAFRRSAAVCTAAVFVLSAYYGCRIYDEAENAAIPSVTENSSSVQTEFSAETTEKTVTAATTKPALTETTAKTTVTVTALTEADTTTSADETASTTVPTEESSETVSVTCQTSVTETTASETTSSPAKESETEASTKKTKKKTSETETESETSAESETEAVTSEETTAKTTAKTDKKDDDRILYTVQTDSMKVPLFTKTEFVDKAYCDVLNEPYEFICDEAVLGTWRTISLTNPYFTIFPNMYFRLSYSANLNNTPHKLIFSDNGEVTLENYQLSGQKLMNSAVFRWTYGLIEMPAVQEYYFYEKYYLYIDENGTEYLFVEHKNGDYMSTREYSPGYFIYIRETEE